ncbi:MAG: L-2-amino-thiazoline-4-carboxylic acid hydrolase [Candidatus Hodarchaeales archaeon]
MMLKTLTKKITRNVIWKTKKKTIAQTLVSRCRKDGMPEYGRFTRREIQQIIIQTDLHIKELIPYFPDLDNIGNYQNIYVGLVDLAIYRALVKKGITREYAANLVADMMWLAAVNAKGMIPVIDPLRKKFLKLRSKDSMTYLGKRLKSMLKYPYSEPGYKTEFYLTDNVYHMDIYSCPVFDFYSQFGEEEMSFFRKTWCTFDYTAAENVIENGKYQRTQTLSHGDRLCDMRWFISK